MKTEVEQISINGVEYVKAGTVKPVQPTGPTKIVILQRGWVMIGNLERTGSDCKLHNAAVIRNWGTTKGLGELALEGPKKDTKLDKCGGLVEFDSLTVVATISCEESKWRSAL